MHSTRSWERELRLEDEAAAGARGGVVTGDQGQLETPVVLIVFNRPAPCRAVFDRIAEMRPRRLLVIADGPRPDRPGERERCEEVRRIATAISWPCELQTNFAQENLGCRARIVSGLRWVFEQVEEAIILEDDILPDPSFFPFCEEMLARFRGDARVSMITGFNIGSDRARTPYSYYFSELTHIWGWATWRTAWQHYDEHMTSWPEARQSGLLQRVFSERSAWRYWRPILEGMYRGTGPKTWDYQWMFTNIVRRSLAVAPQVNLVRNIGFGADATHVGNAEDAPPVGVGSLRFPLQHPPAVVPLRELDLLDQRLSGWHVPPLAERVRRRVRRVLRERLGAAA